jgi:hypothetical protein
MLQQQIDERKEDCANEANEESNNDKQIKYNPNEASPGQALSPRARLLLRRSGVSSKCCFIESAASGGELDP